MGDSEKLRWRVSNQRKKRGCRTFILGEGFWKEKGRDSWAQRKKKKGIGEWISRRDRSKTLFQKDAKKVDKWIAYNVPVQNDQEKP